MFNTLFKPASKFQRYQYSWLPNISNIEISLLPILIHLVHPFSYTMNIFSIWIQPKNANLNFFVIFVPRGATSLNYNQKCTFWLVISFCNKNTFPVIKICHPRKSFIVLEAQFEAHLLYWLSLKQLHHH